MKRRQKKEDFMSLAIDFTIDACIQHLKNCYITYKTKEMEKLIYRPKGVYIDFFRCQILNLSITEYALLETIFQYQSHSSTGWYEVGISNNYTRLSNLKNDLRNKLNLSERPLRIVISKMIMNGFLEEKETGLRVTMQFINPNIVEQSDI